MDGMPHIKVAVRTYTGVYADEWYKNLPAAFTSAGQATPIDLATKDAVGIDFSLGPARQISGRVTGTGGAGLASADLRLFSTAGKQLTSTKTDGTGAYSLTGLPAGSYKLSTAITAGYVDEWFNDLPVLAHPVGDAAPINVTSADSTATNLALVTGRTISGSVSKDGGGQVPGARVAALSPWGIMTPWVNVAAAGTYKVAGLPPGVYKVRTLNTQGFVDEWYNNRTVLTTLPAGANPVNVTSANATGVNFTLSPGRTISGKVTTEQSAALAGIRVGVYPAPGPGSTLEASTVTTGTYVVKGVPPGSYKARTLNASGTGYIDEWYKNLPVFAYTMSAATTITAGSANVTGVDFALAKNVAPTLGAYSPTPLSLHTGQSQLFSATCSDVNGARQLRRVQLLWNTSSSTAAGGVSLLYDENANLLKLLADNGSTWLSGAPGTAATLQNSRATITLSQCSVTRAGASLTLKVTVAFKSAFVGTKNAYLSAQDDCGASIPWTQKGLVTVSSP